jgi:hypothetical protein
VLTLAVIGMIETASPASKIGLGRLAGSIASRDDPQRAAGILF